MLKLLPIKPKIWKKAKKLGVEKKFSKAIKLLSENWRHPGLDVKLLEPKEMKIWSFRVGRKIRGLFIWRKDKKGIEILNLTVHYQ